VRMNQQQIFRVASLSLLLCAANMRPAEAQTQNQKADEGVFTLQSAIQFAAKNYPAVRAALERVNAARAGVSLARTSYLPRAGMLWQTNRATDNNITGLLLPQLDAYHQHLIRRLWGRCPLMCAGSFVSHGDSEAWHHARASSSGRPHVRFSIALPRAT